MKGDCTKRLATTWEASQASGLSVYELRRGYKQGRYPALEIGDGQRSRRLRWNLAVLNEAIEKLMTEGREAV